MPYTATIFCDHSPPPKVPEGARVACEHAAKRFHEALTLADLASAAQLPASTLGRHFQRSFGISPMRWLWSFRTLLAAELIAIHPSWPLQSISRECGFTSQAHFSRRFHALFDETPRAFRKHFLSQQSPTPPAAFQPTMSPLLQDRLTQATLSKLMAKPLHRLR
jgi:AraC-like DNA-binding protein